MCLNNENLYIKITGFKKKINKVKVHRHWRNKFQTESSMQSKISIGILFFFLRCFQKVNTSKYMTSKIYKKSVEAQQQFYNQQ